MTNIQETNLKNSPSTEAINKISKEARISLSSYCLNECHAYCCKKGYLILNEGNVDLVTQNNKKELIINKILTKTDDGYYLNMNSGCPSLKGSMCMVHKDKRRPKVCEEFPLFIKDNIISLSPKCPGVQANKLYPYISKLLSLGLKLK